MGITIDIFARGYGVHTWDFPISKITPTLLRELKAVTAGYGPTTFLTKLCLFILYYRIFSPNAIMRYLIYFGVAFNVIFYVVYTLFYTFYCLDATSGSTKCGRALKLFGVITTAINIADDFYILLIPLSAISTLQLPPARKLGLLAIFFTGFLACLCSIVSLHYRIILLRETDDVWNVVPVLILGTVEFNIGLICSCLPTLPALFRRSSIFSRKTKPSYVPDSGNPEPVRGAAPSGGSKRGFGRLGDMESRDSVAVLESGRRDEGGREYEMNGYQGEDAGRAKEWFKQARM
ncbi:MAG: hypothetical protein LQ346_004213 [Caloplaca aetnensis]|nr:MAG: hypothetical protein LQ346_004213 [Caloplaca aetnensis]